MSKLDVILVKENYELFTRIQNEKRKQLLSFIYLQSRKYKELMEFSGLKPGSLYHHLNILDPLIEKRGHGIYYITDLGRRVVEELKLVEVNNTKPKIQKQNGQNQYTNPVDSIAHIKTKIDSSNDNLSLIWIGNINYVILSLIVIVSIAMAIEGVALAGSSIYAVGTELAFKFDLAAFILGIVAIYSVESVKQTFPIYNRIRFIITIRFMSMLPGTVLSIGLYLLFTSNVVPSSSIYPWLFTISLILGTLTTAVGVSYLRGQSIQKSIDIAILISVIDLLLGIILLMS